MSRPEQNHFYAWATTRVVAGVSMVALTSTVGSMEASDAMAAHFRAKSAEVSAVGKSMQHAVGGYFNKNQPNAAPAAEGRIAAAESHLARRFGEAGAILSFAALGGMMLVSGWKSLRQGPPLPTRTHRQARLDAVRNRGRTSRY